MFFAEMLKRFTNPYNDSVLFIQRRTEVADFVARQPRALPVAPRPARKLSLAQRLLAGGLWLVLAPLLLLAFLVLGERPTLKA